MGVAVAGARILRGYPDLAHVLPAHCPGIDRLPKGFDLGLMAATGTRGVGRLFVWEDGNDRIIAYNKGDGSYVAQYVGAAGQPQFADVRGMFAVDRGDYVAIVGPSGGGKTRLTFSAPSRGLIGYHGEFLSDTRGTGIMNRLFEKYGPYKGPIQGRQNGVLISMEQGEAVAYALNALEERGTLFISPGDRLYEGMVIGENAKPQDLEVNPLKSKQLTNFRASGKDEGIRLTPPRRMTLEQAIAYIQDDELVEVTPKVVRIRKRWLDPHERKRQSRKAEAA
jgi:hypothetical protein